MHLRLLPAHRRRIVLSQPRRHLRRFHPQLQPQRNRAERIAHNVLAGQRKGVVEPIHIHLHGTGTPANIIRNPFLRNGYHTCASVAKHQVVPFAVMVEDGRSSGRKLPEQLRFFEGNPFQGLEVFQMRNPDVGDNSEGRLQQLGQGGNLAGVVHADLEHAMFCRLGHGEHGERQADVVVVVPGGPVCFALHGEHVGAHFLDGGLADAAGDSHNGCAPFFTVAPRQVLQARQHIRNPQ